MAARIVALLVLIVGLAWEYGERSPGLPAAARPSERIGGQWNRIVAPWRTPHLLSVDVETVIPVTKGGRVEPISDCSPGAFRGCFAVESSCSLARPDSAGARKPRGAATDTAFVILSAPSSWRLRHVAMP